MEESKTSYKNQTTFFSSSKKSGEVRMKNSAMRSKKKKNFINRFLQGNGQKPRKNNNINLKDESIGKYLGNL